MSCFVDVFIAVVVFSIVLKGKKKSGFLTREFAKYCEIKSKDLVTAK